MLSLSSNRRENENQSDSNMYGSVSSMLASVTPSEVALLLGAYKHSFLDHLADQETNITPSIVKIISQETIKPSNPTPPHLRTYKLSFLDHIAPPVYCHFILFYETEDAHNCDHHHLKKSLAETLTGFYPLAGKMKRSHEDEFLSVDCTDDGVEYLEARVDAQLHETIKNPDGYLLNQFLPINPYQPLVRIPGSEPGPESKPLLAVQVNTFDCGGVAIGVSISHEIADATALISFIQTWAANAHGGGSGTKPVDPPLIGFESLFPPRALPDFPIGSFRDDVVTKRFVFDSSKISALREKVITINDGSRLTRVEAVSAFLWRCFMNINQEKTRPGSYYPGSLKFLCVGLAVNLRKRIVLPQNSFGNLFFTYLMPMFSIDDDESTEKEYDCFVSRYRDMIRKIDDEEDYIRRELKISGEDGDQYLKYAGKVGEGLQEGEMEILHCSSCCRMGYYEVDFGWGKPVWVSPGTMPVKDLVMLMDTKSGDGIEVWVNMTPEDFDALERDHEFHAFVSS